MHPSQTALLAPLKRPSTGRPERIPVLDKHSVVGRLKQVKADPRSALDETLKHGARRMLHASIEAEVGDQMERHGGHGCLGAAPLLLRPSPAEAGHSPRRQVGAEGVSDGVAVHGTAAPVALGHPRGG